MITVNLHIGARVYCRDTYCGDRHAAMMNRAEDRITDLIVESAPSARLPERQEEARAPQMTTAHTRGKTGRAVPVALTDYVDDRGVHLRIDSEELQTYPESIEGLLTRPERARN
jgi:hypothetical protein